MTTTAAWQEYIISRRFPQKFGRRVLQQYKYHYKRVSVLDNYAILESLPTTARTSLLFAQYHDAVDQLSFLQASLADTSATGSSQSLSQRAIRFAVYIFSSVPSENRLR